MTRPTYTAVKAAVLNAIREVPELAKVSVTWGVPKSAPREMVCIVGAEVDTEHKTMGKMQREAIYRFDGYTNVQIRGDSQEASALRAETIHQHVEASLLDNSALNALTVSVLVALVRVVESTTTEGHETEFQFQVVCRVRLNREDT